MRVADILSEAPAVVARRGAFHLSVDWFAAWDAAYLRKGQRPVSIDGIELLDEIVRLGPIRYRRRRARTNVHTPAFDGTADVAGDVATRLLDGGIAVVTLDYLPEDSPLLAAAANWRHRHVRIEPHARAPAADCRGPYADWLARRSKRIRTRWPRMIGHVTQTLGMSYESFDRFDDLPALLPRLFAVEKSGWKGRNGTAIACNAANTRFYTELAHRAAAAGALRIVTLRDGDRITAFEYAILADERLFVLKVGYDEAYEDASIGHVLATLHIRDCCDDPRIAWYDKLGNGMTPTAYKLRYADTIETLWRVTLYARGWRGQAVRAYDAARRRARRLRDTWRTRKQR